MTPIRTDVVMVEPTADAVLQELRQLKKRKKELEAQLEDMTKQAGTMYGAIQRIDSEIATYFGVIDEMTT